MAAAVPCLVPSFCGNGATASSSGSALVLRCSAGAALPTSSSSCSSSSCNAMLGSTRLLAPATRSWSRRRVQVAGVSPRAESVEEAGNSLDVWLGRLAMLGFVSALGLEIFSGKGLLEAAGVATPAPSVALALTAAVGAVTAFGIFRSGSQE